MKIDLRVFHVIVFLVVLSLISCYSSSSTLSNGYNASSVRKLNYLDPFCNILHFDNATKQYYMDTNSVLVSQNIDTILKTHRKTYRLNDKIEIKDTMLRSNFYKDALSLACSIDEEYKMRDKSITSNISQVLNSQNENYLGLIFYNKGVPYKGQKQSAIFGPSLASVAPTILIAAISQGSILYVPLYGNYRPLQEDGCYLLIFDKNAQRICYYKKVVFSIKNYHDVNTLSSKIDQLFQMFTLPQF